MDILAFVNLRCGAAPLIRLSQPLLAYPSTSRYLLKHMGLEGLFLVSDWGWLFGWLQVPKHKNLKLALVLRRNRAWLEQQKRSVVRRFLRWLWAEPTLIRWAMEKPGLLKLLYPSGSRQLNIQAIRVTKGQLLDILPLLPPGVAQSLVVQHAVLRWRSKALLLLLRYQAYDNHLFWTVLRNHGWQIFPILWEKWRVTNLLESCRKKYRQMPWLRCRILRLVKGSDPLREQIHLLHKNGVQGPTKLLGLDAQQWPMSGIFTAMVLLASGKSLSHEEKFWFAFDLVLLATDVISTVASAGTVPPGKSIVLKRMSKRILRRMGKVGVRLSLRRGFRHLKKRHVRQTFQQNINKLFRRTLRRVSLDSNRRGSALERWISRKQALLFCKQKLPFLKNQSLCSWMLRRGSIRSKRRTKYKHRNEHRGNRKYREGKVKEDLGKKKDDRNKVEKAKRKAEKDKKEEAAEKIRERLQDVREQLQQTASQNTPAVRRKRILRRTRMLRRHGILAWFGQLRYVLPYLSMEQVIQMAILARPGAAVIFQPPKARIYEVYRSKRTARFLHLSFAGHRFLSRIHSILADRKVSPFALLRMHEALEALGQRSTCPRLSTSTRRAL